ncbi:hypothetical protein I4U23_028012 [Adineta vaga]|nr:hypothetical protein I4U23_028012 [Adineta vaga]
MNSTYEPSPRMIDPFVLHFLSSTIDPPPPLPLAIFFYDPFLVVPPPPPPSSPTYSFSSLSPPLPKSPIKPILPPRHRYTPLQLLTLNRIFLQLPYPSLEQRRMIAEHLHIDVEQVRIWFSNRRSRRRGSNHQTNLIEPTSKEYFHLKELFNQLNLSI